jgi:cytochrome c oxidase cbb3-type subunit 3
LIPAIRRHLPGALALLAFAVQPTQASVHEEGRAVYNFRCYFCHGYSGDAKTLAATFLSPPPANFTSPTHQALSRESILTTLRQGRPGTAMKSFAETLSAREMEVVASFVVDEFVVHRAPNTRYHTIENGWPDHERYRSAYPFATGEIPLSQAWESLSETQSAGKRLYLNACVSCHDRGAGTPDDTVWDARPLSYPRGGFSLANPPKVDAMTGATPYALHDIAPRTKGLRPIEKRGEKLFQNNCAFCHGADGTGKNWIGQFLEPHARNLRDPVFMAGMTRQRLSQVIREGLPNTSMPAWKDVLGNSDIRALLAYINRVFHPLKEEDRPQPTAPKPE